MFPKETTFLLAVSGGGSFAFQTSMCQRTLFLLRVLHNWLCFSFLLSLWDKSYKIKPYSSLPFCKHLQISLLFFLHSLNSILASGYCVYLHHYSCPYSQWFNIPKSRPWPPTLTVFTYLIINNIYTFPKSVLSISLFKLNILLFLILQSLSWKHPSLALWNTGRTQYLYSVYVHGVSRKNPEKCPILQAIKTLSLDVQV